MAKNIVIFSDGTGQAGGLLPDETRSNVYKLYRAARVCPDTTIDPAKQVAFYDVGLGSKAAGGNIKVGWWRRIYRLGHADIATTAIYADAMGAEEREIAARMW